MATKCVDQMPEPAAAPVNAAHMKRRGPVELAAIEYIRKDVSVVAMQTSAARTTSQGSWSVATGDDAIHGLTVAMNSA
jgi:hypothetical protein